jgi:hypothetical protein
MTLFDFECLRLSLMDELPRPFLDQAQLTAVAEASLKTRDPDIIRISTFLMGILQPSFEVVDLRLCQSGPEQHYLYSVFLKYRTPGYFHSTYSFLAESFRLAHKNDSRGQSLQESIKREREIAIANRS